MGNPATDKKARQRLRRRLEHQGVHPADIDRRVAALARRQQTLNNQQATTDAERRARIQQLHAEREGTYQATYDRLNGDDRKYRPGRHDPITQGQARATGLTAAAAKRGRTFTKFEHDQAAGS